MIWIVPIVFGLVCLAFILPGFNDKPWVTKLDDMKPRLGRNERGEQ